MYLSTPSAPIVREAMTQRRIGCMTTPKQGNRIPDGALYACDNGKFGKGYPGDDGWRAWLTKRIAEYGADRCLFAVAPDVPMDSAGTLRESLPHLPFIRSLGVPAAFVAQDGSEAPGMVPWDSFDVLFIGGSTDWKIGPSAAELCREAKARGKQVHVGRVNSRLRLQHCAAVDADTADGTYIAFGPAKNLERIERWLGELGLAQRPVEAAR